MLEYAASIWRCRNFWLSLVGNDLQMRYRRSALGVGWSLLHPLATTLVLGAVFHGIFQRPIREYLPYLLCGLGCWAYLTGVISQGCQSYIQAEPYIRQHPLPMAIYPLRITLGLLIHHLIALAVVVVLSVSLRGWDKFPDLLSLALALPILFLFGWAAGILAGFVNVIFRDTQHALDIGFQVLFYLTPVIYPADFLKSTRAGHLAAFNPLAPFVDLIRDPIIHGHPADQATWYAASLITLTAVGIAILSLNVQQKRVVLYL